MYSADTKDKSKRKALKRVIAAMRRVRGAVTRVIPVTGPGKENMEHLRVMSQSEGLGKTGGAQTDIALILSLY